MLKLVCLINHKCKPSNHNTSKPQQNFITILGSYVKDTIWWGVPPNSGLTPLPLGCLSLPLRPTSVFISWALVTGQCLLIPSLYITIHLIPTPSLQHSLPQLVISDTCKVYCVYSVCSQYYILCTYSGVCDIWLETIQLTECTYVTFVCYNCVKLCACMLHVSNQSKIHVHICTC